MPSIVSYLWDFGDGTTSALQSPSHSYATPGWYTVSLTTEDDEDQTATRYYRIQVVETSDVPTDIEYYRWDFGDGSVAYDPQVFHSYSASGWYQISLLTRDDEDQETTRYYRIQVAEFNETPTNIVEYRWDFGDGAISYGQMLYHEYNMVGFKTITLRTTDDHGVVQYRRHLLEVIAPIQGDYFWDFGDGITAFGSPVEHAYRYVGTYPMSLYIGSGPTQDVLSTIDGPPWVSANYYLNTCTFFTNYITSSQFSYQQVGTGFFVYNAASLPKAYQRIRASFVTKRTTSGGTPIPNFIEISDVAITNINNINFQRNGVRLGLRYAYTTDSKYWLSLAIRVTSTHTYLAEVEIPFSSTELVYLSLELEMECDNTYGSGASFYITARATATTQGNTYVLNYNRTLINLLQYSSNFFNNGNQMQPVAGVHGFNVTNPQTECCIYDFEFTYGTLANKYTRLITVEGGDYLMNYPNRITNHSQQLVDFLPEQFKQSTNIISMLEVIGGQVQELEDTLEDMYVMTQLDQAENAQLDTLGVIAGQSRDSGYTEAQYRNRIKGRIIYNYTSGSIDNLINFIDFYGSHGEIVATEYPGEVYITIENGFAITTEFLNEIRRMVAAGVKLVIASVSSSVLPFTFTDAIGAEPAGGGFSNNGTGGGTFVSIN